jgi:dTDP-4-amino-4,6-dideoxygalactose transaminase
MTEPVDNIPFVDLRMQRRRLGRSLDEAVQRVMDHGQFILGPEVTQLENQLSAFAGAKHCVSCANGTDALGLVLIAEGVGPGDAVFVPAFTFAATAEVVSWVGATPVFVDVIEDTFNLDPARLETAIALGKRQGLRPRAVIPVDLFGQPADYTALAPIAAAHDMFVLCDAAQSFGASLGGRRVGTFGRATATSFFPAKPLGCYGDGGAVLTDDDDLAAVLRSLRAHGQGTNKYDNVRIGINGRLDTMQAAILLQKLTIFEDEIEARQRIARRYADLLGDVVRLPQLIEGAVSTWAQYTIVTERRDSVITACKRAGVPTAIYYPIPLSRQTAYKHFPSGPEGVPVSERLAQQVVSLPMHPYLDPATQERVAAAVRDGTLANRPAV